MSLLSKIALVLLLFGSLPASANTDIVVFPAELSVAFETVPGRVVLAGSQVLFWSESTAYPAFYFDKGSVQRFSLTNGVLSIELKQAIPIRDGSRSRFDLRALGELDAAAVERWFSQTGLQGGLGPSSPGGTGAAAAPGAMASAGALSFDAEHQRRFGGNRNGKLVFTAQGIAWESLNDATQSRTWEYKAIRRLERKNPYEVVVDTFSDGKYAFKMTTKPMGNEDYSTITDYLAAARSAARQ